MTKEELIADLQPGSTWRHRDGEIYQIMFLTNLSDGEKYPLSVTYFDSKGDRWSARADDWHRRMTKI